MICVSLAESSLERALSALREAEKEADLCEIRLDAMESPAVNPFLSVREKPLLFTFRAAEEGGFRSVPLSERLSLLSEAAEAGAEYVDLELAAGSEAIKKLKERLFGGRLLLSFHDFSGTPETDFLREKVREMADLGADLGKVVTMAREPSDGLRVLELIPWARETLGFPLVAFAMGEAGRWTRPVSLLLGAPFTFAAPESRNATAPGQLTVGELREVLRVL